MRIHTIIPIGFLLISLGTYAQNASADLLSEVESWQKNLNKEYKEKATSPLSEEKIKLFTGHDFFNADTSYITEATLHLSNNKNEILFKTSTDKILMHTKYGELTFLLKGQSFTLNLYQSPQLMKIPKYADYLFLPFTDYTTGIETYGGGRYIDLKIPSKGNKILLDFNRAYNPYCAYSANYSCPKVPEENDLKIRILAGVKNKNL